MMPSHSCHCDLTLPWKVLLFLSNHVHQKVASVMLLRRVFFLELGLMLRILDKVELRSVGKRADALM